MSNTVTRTDVEDVLHSIRRLVGETKPAVPEDKHQNGKDRLVLTPQHRVADADVLMLRPEDAVKIPEWLEFEESPLDRIQAVPSDASEDAVKIPEWLEFEEPPLDRFHGVPSDASEDAASKPAGEETASKPARTDVAELTAKIAALETAIAKTQDQWEPDGTGRDAYAGTEPPAMDWTENVELDATGKPLARLVETKSADTSGATAITEEDALEESLEEQVIDEEMLREIVAEIVRSELQGALGERITRNVRKLVRREIHRFLVAQSLQ